MARPCGQGAARAWRRKEDFIRILTEPENNMIRQQQALLATEGIDLHFTEDAIQEARACTAWLCCRSRSWEQPV